MDSPPHQRSASPENLEILKFWRRKLTQALDHPEPMLVYQDLPPKFRERPGIMSLYLLLQLAKNPTTIGTSQELEKLVLIAETFLGKNDAEAMLCREDLRRWCAIRDGQGDEQEIPQDKLRQLFMEERLENLWRNIKIILATWEPSEEEPVDLSDLLPAIWPLLLFEQSSRVKDVLDLILDVHRRFPSQKDSDLEIVEEAKKIWELKEEQTLVEHKTTIPDDSKTST